MNKVCRTCGFADCPGANGGSCPRWPARNTSDLDRLTLDDLYDLHNKLGDEGQRLHDRFMALPTTISEEANLLMAKCAEISETMGAVYAVIKVRQVEAGIYDSQIEPTDA